MSYANLDIREAFGEGGEEGYARVAAGLAGVAREGGAARRGGDWGKLVAAARGHRVLLLRTGAVIAVSTVISVGGAILLHLMAAGVVVAGVWLSPAGAGGGGGHVLAGAEDFGGAPGGFMVLGDGADSNAPPSAEGQVSGDGKSGDLRSEVAAAGMTEAGVSLPALPEARVAGDGKSGDLRSEVAAAVMPSLGVENLGTVQIAGGPVASTPAAVAVVPPTGASGAGLANGGVNGDGNPPRGTGTGSGGGEIDQPLGLFRGDGGGGSGAGGSGRGSGAGRGGGVDRGALFAYVSPQFLGFSREAPELALPEKYRATLAKKAVTLTVSIAADGSVEGVRVEESCGVAEVDEMCREYMAANGRFSPARKDGKALATEIPFSFGKID